MARLVFYAICIIGLVNLGLAGYIRWELAGPGVLPITELNPTRSPADLYADIAQIHGRFAAALLFFVAAFLAFNSAERKAPMAIVWGTASIVIGTVLLFIAVWFMLYVFDVRDVPALPLELSQNPALLSDSIVARIFSEPYIRATALTLTFLAMASAICTVASYRLGSILIAGTTLVAFGIKSYLILTNVGELGISFFLLPLVTMMLILAVILIDQNRPDEPHLTVGIGVALISSVAMDMLSSIVSNNLNSNQSYFLVSQKHLAQHVLLLFVFFTAYFRTFAPMVSQLVAWVHAMALGIAVFVTYLPLMIIGIQGARARTINSPSAYPDMQYWSSIGYLAIVVVILWGLTIGWTRQADTSSR